MTDLEKRLRDHGGAPEHTPGFETRLWAAIDELDARQRDDANDSASTPATVTRSSKRRTKWWTALAAAILAAIAAITFFSVRDLGHPSTASAGEVTAQVRHSLSTFKTISATAVTHYVMVVTATPGTTDTDAEWLAKCKVLKEYSQDQKSEIIATDEGYSRTNTQIISSFSISLKPDGTVGSFIPARTDVQLLRKDVKPEIVDISDSHAGVRYSYTPGYYFVDKSNLSKNEVHAGESAQREVDMPLGPSPDSESSCEYPWTAISQDLIGNCSVLSIMAQGTVSETTYNDRPALKVSVEAMPDDVQNDPYPFDRLEMTVDEATYFPVRFTALLNGQVVEDIELSDVKLDAKVPDETFAPPFPKDAKVNVVNWGFHSVTLAEAAQAFDYRPLVPTSSALPGNFHFFTAAVAPKAAVMASEIAPNGDLNGFYGSGTDVIQTQYRSGFLAFTITTRHDAASDDSDPFVSNDPLVIKGANHDKEETVTMTDGALKGQKAQLVMPAFGYPHLWASDSKSDLMVTVAGDLTRDQLLQVANSLEPLE